MEDKNLVEKRMDCKGCRFLLHYEFDGKKYNLPRCSIGFRDGTKVNHPCKDKLKLEIS